WGGWSARGRRRAVTAERRAAAGAGGATTPRGLDARAPRSRWGQVMQVHLDARDLFDLAKIRLPALKKQIPFAMAGALDDQMYRSRTALIEEMGRVFDRPTPYVMRSLRYRKATKTDLTFELWSEEFGGSMPPAQVLAAEVAGGERKMKRSEVRL